jgi:hypothetical protein
MQKVAAAFVDDALPTLDPIIAHEDTEQGWRGLTEHGEVLVVRSANGHKVTVPDDGLLVVRDGVPIGRRLIEQRDVSIEDYLTHFNRAVALFRNNEIDDALIQIDAAVGEARTTRARFNRALILLSLGRWPEGFDEYEQCERQAPFQRPLSRQAIEAGLTPWRGEDISGKRLLLLHDHGFGDTIMALRYVPVLRAMGADVVMMMPQELRRLAVQFGNVTANSMRVIEADYFCPMLLLLHALRATPDKIPITPGYIELEAELVERWRTRLAKFTHRRIGIAWSVGQHNDHDYPRACPLSLIDQALPKDADIFSVQAQGGEDADALGINVPIFEDFADCAAFMACMDDIVSVDTAALHLAGAIGHPRVTGLLSHWSSWRWLAPWYPQVNLLRQSTPGYWPSALTQMGQAHEHDGKPEAGAASAADVQRSAGGGAVA